jgi:RimJ/RimL family protein N-acetyltransferase
MPSERIVLRDLVLRRWSPDDAAVLTTAVQKSFEHLRPWMPWAAERPSLRDEQGFLDRMVRMWDAGEVFAYGIFEPSEKALLGGVGLYDDPGPGAWEIGYWVHIDHTRRGVATTGAAALTGLALTLDGTERVEIQCDQSNKASAAVAARLGYRLDRIEDDEKDTPGKSGNQMVWVMNRDAYPGSAAEIHLRESA